MPLPFAHSLMAVAVHEATRGSEGRTLGVLLALVVVANLPDADFLPGFLTGDANRYHSVWSHSLGAAVVVGAAIAAFAAFRGGRPAPTFLLFGGVYFSHVVLDSLAVDGRPPYGVMMWWPLSDARLISPWPVFMSVDKVGRSDGFFQSLFVAHNLRAALWEIAVFAPVVLLVRAARKRRVQD